MWQYNRSPMPDFKLHPLKGILRLILARISALFQKRDLDHDFNEELRSHITLATEDYMQRGVPPPEALRMARVKFGAIEAFKDAHRDARGLPWLEGLFYDLRFALRRLRRDRAFTLAAIAMLALAIGLNVTVFAVMNTMLFRGFPLVRGTTGWFISRSSIHRANAASLTWISRIGAPRRTLSREWHLSAEENISRTKWKQ